MPVISDYAGGGHYLSRLFARYDEAGTGKADRLHLKNVTFRQGDVEHSPNPMAYNELFALAFVAPYVASEKKNSTNGRAGNDAPLSLYHIHGILQRPTGIPTSGKK